MIAKLKVVGHSHFHLFFSSWWKSNCVGCQFLANKVSESLKF